VIVVIVVLDPVLVVLVSQLGIVAAALVPVAAMAAPAGSTIVATPIPPARMPTDHLLPYFM
jgi:hypothetical protein